MSGTAACNRGGISPIERLLQHDLLGPRTMLGHCIHVTPAEMDIIKETGTHVVNNPESNMGNAVGCAPVLQIYRRGIPVHMGTDAYTHDMLESLKVFLTIQRHNACHAQRGLGARPWTCSSRTTPPWRASTSGARLWAFSGPAPRPTSS